MLCSCGYKTRYREMRVRRVLTAVGEVELLRAWYLCPHCHNGQCPADATMDIEKTDLSPGVHRMPAKCSPTVSGYWPLSRNAGKRSTSNKPASRCVKPNPASLDETMRAQAKLDVAAKA
jgi:hypothetical protein